MHPVTLTFAGHGVEARFERWRLDRWFRWADMAFLVLAVLTRLARSQPACLRLAWWQVDQCREIQPCWPRDWGLAWAVFDFLVTSRIAVSRRHQWRSASVICSRTLVTLEAMLGCADSISSLAPPTPPASPSSLSILSSSGFWTLWIAGLIRPTRFVEHLPLQLAASLIVAGTAGLDACRDASFCQPHGETSPSIGSLSTAIDAAAKGVLTAMYTSAGTTGALTWRVADPCAQTVLFLHLFLGFVVVSYLVWVWERRSRREFAETVLTDDERRIDRVAPLSAVAASGQLILLVASFGICWRALLYVSPEAHSWQRWAIGPRG